MSAGSQSRRWWQSSSAYEGKKQVTNSLPLTSDTQTPSGGMRKEMRAKKRRSRRSCALFADWASESIAHSDTSRELLFFPVSAAAAATSRSRLGIELALSHSLLYPCLEHQRLCGSKCGSSCDRANNGRTKRRETYRNLVHFASCSADQRERRRMPSQRLHMPASPPDRIPAS
jgi:hypothetical protein